MTLQMRAHVRLAAFHLDIALDADRGQTIAVVGPNGAGKTTLLRALAGLVPLDAGRIVLDDVPLDDPGRSVFVPTEQRPIGIVFQDYLLFPHLSALENVAFGPRCRGATRADARARATVWLERVGLGEMAGARPRELSGGQSQRVALARALASDPQLLLLDEPLAALDASARGAVRRELRDHLASFDGIRVLVTHDVVDAVALADRLVILESGRVVQAGELSDVTARPRSQYAAELVGVNLLEGRAHGVRIDLGGASALVTAEGHDGEVFAVVRPQAVALYTRAPEGSPRNTWPARVETVEMLGDRVRVSLAGDVPLVAEVTRAALRELGLGPGMRVWATVKATDVSVYAA